MTPPDLLTVDDEPEIPMEEPEIPMEPEPEIVQVPEPEPAALAPVALMQVLPADFPLPALIRFVPDVRLKAQADDAARYALSLNVSGPEGLQAADDALVGLRGAQKAIEEHFSEPVEIANKLHKSLTGTRAEWLSAGKAAGDTVGRKVYVETQRLKALADEERRKAQAKADEEARAAAKKRAEEAAKAQAPKAIVENLQRQAETAKAAPVMPTAAAPPKLAGTSVVKKWTCTIAGTPRDAEQQPCMADLTDAQRAEVLGLMRDVLDGKAPLRCFEIDWGYAKKRATSDESSFNIPHLEAYDAGGTRAKGSRSK